LGASRGGVSFGVALGVTGLVIAVLGWMPLELELRYGTPGSNPVGYGILAWLCTGLGGVMVLLALATLEFTRRNAEPAVARGFDPMKLDFVETGMSRSQVERTLGTPIEEWHHRVQGRADLIYLAYSKRTVSGDTYYDVVILSTEGKVIRTARNCTA
jgi:hypothetical protein